MQNIKDLMQLKLGLESIKGLKSDLRVSDLFWDSDLNMNLKVFPLSFLLMQACGCWMG